MRKAWLALWFTGCAGGPDDSVGDTDADTDADSDSDADSDTDVDTSLSFFVTSSGTGADGGDFGGLAGADARCQALATAVGAGSRTWHAYLSTSDGSARDRIGDGPWFDVTGVQVAADVEALHESGIASSSILDENGDPVPREEHDIVTGSAPDGTPEYNGAYTCYDWTSSAGDIYAQVGHADWSSDENLYDNWNSSHTTPCSEDGMASTLSAGRTYCFAL